MNLKKTLAAGAACALLLAVMAVPASAHGGRHHSGATSNRGYAVCTVEDCTETGRHYHDGVTYCGYDHTSGYCNGSACSGGYAVCTVEDCTETGRHDHDGVTYCGYDHTSGYCTGSACNGGGCGRGRGHRGGHC